MKFGIKDRSGRWWNGSCWGAEQARETFWAVRELPDELPEDNSEDAGVLELDGNSRDPLEMIYIDLDGEPCASVYPVGSRSRRIEIRPISGNSEAGLGALEEPCAWAADAAEAHECAAEIANEWHYGVALVDNDEGSIDWGGEVTTLAGRPWSDEDEDEDE